MDENEFRQLIDLFPVVRSPDYHVKDWQDARSTEDKNEAFWGKLKLAAEQKLGAADAERFCKAFQQVYKQLVYEELTTDDARRVLKL